MEAFALDAQKRKLRLAFGAVTVAQVVIAVSLVIRGLTGFGAVPMVMATAVFLSSVASYWVLRTINVIFDSEQHQLNEENLELQKQKEELGSVLAKEQQTQNELKEALDLAEIQKSMQEHASRRFQSLFDGLPIGAATFDGDGTIFESNPQMAELTGVPSHHAVLHPISKALRWSENPETVDGIVGQVMHDGEMVSINHSFDVDGSQRTVNFRFFPLKNRDGEILGGIVCGLDITEDLINKRRLEDMAAFQSAVLDAAQYSIVWADPQGVVIGMNNAAEALLGYTESETIGRMCISDFHPKTEILLRQAEIEAKTGHVLETGQELYDCLIAHPEGINPEWQYKTANGNHIDIHLSLSQIQSNGGDVRGYLAVAQDITSEKAVAEQLRMLSMVAMKSMNSVLVLDPAACIIYANKAFSKLSGFGFEDVVGEMPFGFRTVHEGQEADCLALNEALRNRCDFRCELKLRHAMSHDYWSRISITPINNEAGVCTHIVVIEEDITEQKEAQLQIMASEARFRDVVESAGEYVWEVNSDFRFTFVSNKVEDVLGYLPEELIGHNPLDFIERDDVREVQNRIAESVLDGMPVKNLLLNSNGKFGQKVWQRFNAIPVFAQDGELAGFRGTSLDVTEQKAAEDALAFANMRIQRILESINDCFYSLDASGRFTYVNQAAAASSGVEPRDLIGLQVWETMPETFWSPVRDLFTRVQDTGQTDTLEFMYPPTGSWLEYRVYKNLEGGVSAFYQDITNRKDTERQIEAQMADLNEANVRLEIQQSMLQEANEKLLNLASTDGLTGLKNHKTFQEFLSDKLSAADLAGISVGVALMDVDKFKLFNDGFGHLAGDEVLKKVARTLQDTVREPHFVARYGGEEFVIVGVGLTEDKMFELAEECRISIEEQEWPHRQVTASFGVSMYSSSVANKAELIDRADQALYASKEAGRNRVTLWSQMQEPKAA